MQIALNLPHVFTADASPVENAKCLRALMTCLVHINMSYLQHHSVLPLYRSGVVYGRTTLWEPIPAVIQRGYGDCKSLAAWLVAERRARYYCAKPVFRWIMRPDRGTDFHILVQTDAGFEDPSKVLGMGTHENAR